MILTGFFRKRGTHQDQNWIGTEYYESIIIRDNGCVEILAKPNNKGIDGLFTSPVTNIKFEENVVIIETKNTKYIFDKKGEDE